MGQNGERVGSVEALWRYPVQSMRGEALTQAEVGASGICGDRAYGVVDPEIGKAVTSAGGKRKWRDLVTYAARFATPPVPGAPLPAVEIALPDGTRLAGDQPDINDRLSALLGHPVRFASLVTTEAAYAVSPLHLLTTATLRELSRHHPEGRFEPARFRPNIVIDTAESTGFLETGWIGRELAIGESLRLRIADHCRRCVMTVLPQGDLPQDPAILQTVSERNATRAGIYAEILEPGAIRQGDAVRLLG